MPEMTATLHVLEGNAEATNIIDAHSMCWLMCYRRCGVGNRGAVINMWSSQKWRNHAVERWFTIPSARGN